MSKKVTFFYIRVWKYVDARLAIYAYILASQSERRIGQWVDLYTMLDVTVRFGTMVFIRPNASAIMRCSMLFRSGSAFLFTSPKTHLNLTADLLCFSIERGRLLRCAISC